MSFRTLCLWMLGSLLVASGIVVRVVPMDGHVRLLLVLTFCVALLTGIVYFFKLLARQPAAIFPAFFFLTLFVVWSVLGSKPPDDFMLRSVYLRQLRSFVGVKFQWGGESYEGIDCSGLARVALWQAMLKEGVKEVNPRLLGSTLWKFWWRDVGAKDIGEGKYHYTRVIGYAPKLAGYDTSKLKTGDMAVASASHIMVYDGRGKWIEANPQDGKVVINKAAPSSKREWFNTPVTLVRWWILSN